MQKKKIVGIVVLLLLVCIILQKYIKELHNMRASQTICKARQGKTIHFRLPLFVVEFLGF